MLDVRRETYDVRRKMYDGLYHYIIRHTSYVIRHTSHVSPPNSHFIRHNPRLFAGRRVPLWQLLHGLCLDLDVLHILVRDFVTQDADPRFVVLLQRWVEGQRDLLGITVLFAVGGVRYQDFLRHEDPL